MMILHFFPSNIPWRWRWQSIPKMKQLQHTTKLNLKSQRYKIFRNRVRKTII